MNVVVISGNIVADPELMTTAAGVELCRFTVAVSRRYPSKDTDFFSCVAWREQAEFICRNFKKGQRIELSGSMECKKYEGKDGKNRSSWEVNVHGVGFAGGKKEEAKASPEAGATSISPDEYISANFEELAGDSDLPF